MKEFAQNPRDKILWVTTNFGGKMTQGKLSRRTRIRGEELDIVLEELEKEWQIVMVEK